MKELPNVKYNPRFQVIVFCLLSKNDDSFRLLNTAVLLTKQIYACFLLIKQNVSKS